MGGFRGAGANTHSVVYSAKVLFLFFLVALRSRWVDELGHVRVGSW